MLRLLLISHKIESNIAIKLNCYCLMWENNLTYEASIVMTDFKSCLNFVCQQDLAVSVAQAFYFGLSELQKRSVFDCVSRDKKYLILSGKVVVIMQKSFSIRDICFKTMCCKNVKQF